MVDFLIVGAARAGTTTLFELLSRHPGIFIPKRKECRYFSCMPGNSVMPGPPYSMNIIQSREEYRSLFKTAEPGQLRGDISPDYLYFHQNAAPKILNEINAQIPIIIVLRNPIDRAYSHYLHHVSGGRENLAFKDALKAEQERRATNWAWGWNYVDVGLYSGQVKAYAESFGRVLLLLFERDIVMGLAEQKILDFLDLDPESTAAGHFISNISGYPKYRWLHRVMSDELIVRKVKNVVKATPLYSASKRVYSKLYQANLKKEDMAPETREMLKNEFQKDVDLLTEQTDIPVKKYWTDFQ